MTAEEAAVTLLKGSLETATGLPVYVMVDPGSLSPDAVPTYLTIVLQGEENTATEEDEATGYREDLWAWWAYLVTSAVGRTPLEALLQAAVVKAQVRDALVGEEVDALCDGIRCGRWEFAGFASGGQVYRMALSYHRTGG